ncbi:AraC family transcriptional regulator [Actibacterium sp. 188UL27-1]|uniref:helix-turn-helix domain-containing protein n=1 Tax=Actibacterium sp. 188UL27-1 TaxID=2786961 RepID=UPI00195C2FEF|nr:AraC family transcriptional regulator [Actibacterium sp. 188UL27-1]MBM7070286.1 helix-turn-helix transcriptional regulator [Actibacterium sp. 188UL27-1]
MILRSTALYKLLHFYAANGDEAERPNPDYYLSRQAVWEGVADERELNDLIAQSVSNELIGLVSRLCRDYTPALSGEFGYLWSSQRTLGTAIDTYLAYMPDQMPGLTISKSSENGVVTLGYRVRGNRYSQLPMLCVPLMAREIRITSGAQIEMAGSSSAIASKAALRFDEQHLHAKMPRNDPYLVALMDEHVKRRQSTIAEQDIVAALESHLDRQLSNESESRIQDLAETLGTSARSLQRRLASENRTLTEMKDSVRHDRAIELLAYTNTPIKTIATALGYTSVSAFYRAFDRWENCSPGGYRKRCSR